MRRRLAAAAPIALGAANAAACSPPDGWRALAGRAPRTIIFGEVHGTEQSPRIVGEVACALAARGGRVLVAVEPPVQEDAALQAAWRGPADGFARRLLATMPVWRARPAGMASSAWFAMLVRLHARKQASDMGGVRIGWMAARMGPNVLSLDVAMSGGDAYNCVLAREPAPGAPVAAADLDCGPHPAGGAPGLPGGPRILLRRALPAGVPLDPAYDGYHFIGRATASPPVPAEGDAS